MLYVLLGIFSLILSAYIIALIQDNKTNQKRFIKQSELCDIGILCIK